MDPGVRGFFEYDDSSSVSISVICFFCVLFQVSSNARLILTTLRPPRLCGLSHHSQRDAATMCHNVIPSGVRLSLATVAPLETGSYWDE